jgi:hypothetical protein
MLQRVWIVIATILLVGASSAALLAQEPPPADSSKQNLGQFVPPPAPAQPVNSESEGSTLTGFLIIAVVVLGTWALTRKPKVYLLGPPPAKSDPQPSLGTALLLIGGVILLIYLFAR